MSGWDSYVRQWTLHAQSPRFAARVDRAIAVAREGAAKGKLFCSLSGGKDSVAMVGLLAEAGVDVPAVYAHTALNMPDMLETVEVVHIGASFGGIAGFHRLEVRIRAYPD